MVTRSVDKKQNHSELSPGDQPYKKTQDPLPIDTRNPDYNQTLLSSSTVGPFDPYNELSELVTYSKGPFL